MADLRQEEYTIQFQLLKPKYQNPERIKAYCKEVATYTRATIDVQPQRRGPTKFMIIGQSGAVRRAVQYIQGEFIIRQKLPHVRQTRGQDGFLLPRLEFPGLSGPRESANTLSEGDQQSLTLADADQPCLLTVAALRMHDQLTGTCELREFACEPCDSVWWKAVSATKMVSRCKRCNKRYDALPHHEEFGIGRFICQNCGHVFLSKCIATSNCPCFQCRTSVSKPYIHPKFKLHNPKPGHRHYCDLCKGCGQCPTCRRVVFASKEHDSTGSTLSSFFSQLDFGGDDAPFFSFQADGMPMLAENPPSSSGSDTD